MPAIVIPEEVRRTAQETVGKFFEPISKVDRVTSAADFLEPSKAHKHAAILERYTMLPGARLLEVGSGFGTNLAAWIKHYGVDGYGIEPGGEGFEHGLEASRTVFRENGIDPGRIIEGCGESLPYRDESFDIVYSANVLEHTSDPARVLAESVRVLKRGGLLHMEMPNHLSYFEGHYMVVQPPIVWKPMLAWWVGMCSGGTRRLRARCTLRSIQPGAAEQSAKLTGHIRWNWFRWAGTYSSRGCRNRSALRRRWPLAVLGSWSV